MACRTLGRTRTTKVRISSIIRYSLNAERRRATTVKQRRLRRTMRRSWMTAVFLRIIRLNHSFILWVPEETLALINCSVTQFGTWQVAGILGIIIFYGSIPFFGLTLYAYWIDRSSQTVHGWTVASHVLCHMLGNFFIATSNLLPLVSDTSGMIGFCKFLGIMTHFFFLSTIFWLTSINIDLWLTFRCAILQAHACLYCAERWIWCLQEGQTRFSTESPAWKILVLRCLLCRLFCVHRSHRAGYGCFVWKWTWVMSTQNLHISETRVTC